MIENPLSEKLLADELGAGDTVEVDFEDGELTFERV